MNSIKRFIILVLFITSQAVNINGQWIAEQVQSTSNLNSIHFLNENYGWIVGDKGTILFKYENEWLKYPALSDANLYGVFFNDISDGWAVGSEGTILHYNGLEWGSFPSPTKETLYSMTFRDPDHGFAVGEHGTLLFYENGKWNLAEKRTKGNLYAVATKNGLSMVGGGLENISIPIMRIKNAGFDLVDTFDPDFIRIKGIAITDQKSIWAVGRPGVIFHFNGKSWKNLTKFERLPTLNSVCFSDDKNGITVGYNGTILIFSSTGWNKELSPVNVRFNGTTISGNTFYAVGNAGTVISSKRYSAPINKPINNIATKIVIESYPNPSTNLLNIILPIDEEEDFDNAILTITDASGKLILTNRLSIFSTGQVYQINTSEFRTGFYMISIISDGNLSASGRFVVKH